MLIVAELGKSVYKIPNIFIIRVKYMRTVFMNGDIILVFIIINISTYMFTFFSNENFIPGFC